MTSLGIVLMAAGSGSRFGSDKRLYLINGQTLLQRSLHNALASGLPTWLALRDDDGDNLPSLLGPLQHHPRLQLRFMQQAQLGLGHNLAQVFTSAPPWDGALICLGDMAWLQAHSIQQVATAYQPGQIVVPYHGQQAGHPVLFSRAWYSQLARLSGQSGAKPLWQQHPDKVKKLQLNDSGICRDLDNPPADQAQLR